MSILRFLNEKLRGRVLITALMLLFWWQAGSLGTCCAEPLSKAAHDALVKAQNLIEKRELDRALEVLAPYLENKSPSIHALTLAAAACMEKDDLEGAKNFWEKAAAIYPDKSFLKFNLAMTAYRMEDYDTAISWLTQVLEDAQEKEINQDQCRYYIALAYYNKDNPQKAEKNILPLSSRIEAKQEWIRLAFYTQFSQKKWKKAEKSIVRLILKDPGNLTYLRLYRDLELSRQRITSAIALQEIYLAQGAVRTDLSNNESRERARLFNWYTYLNALPEQVRLAEEENLITLETVQQMLNLCEPEKALGALEKLEKEQERSIESQWLKGRALLALDKKALAVTELLSTQSLSLSQKGKEGRSHKEIRNKKDKLISQSLLLAGQICWLDHEWLKARDIFKQLATQPGQVRNARVLYNCMQAILDEAVE